MLTPTLIGDLDPGLFAHSVDFVLGDTGVVTLVTLLQTLDLHPATGLEQAWASTGSDHDMVIITWR